MNAPTGSGTLTITDTQRRFSKALADVLIYLVVLNLFVEFVGAVVIDSFYISILTAILLTALLDVLVVVEHKVHAYFASKETVFFNVVGIVCVFLILFTSKLIILEIVNWVFGDHVELGHFIDVLLLIISMMAARRLVQEIYERLGKTAD